MEFDHLFHPPLDRDPLFDLPSEGVDFGDRLDELKATRKRASEQINAQPNIFDEGEERVFSPQDYLRCFWPLRLRPGYRMGCREVEHSNGYEKVVQLVFTASNGQDLDSDSMMEALQGDDTPWSYLLASFFWRDVEAAGDIYMGWGGWSGHMFVSSAEEAETASFFGPPDNQEERWTWSFKPKDFLPRVFMDRETAKVVFYSYCGSGLEAISQHLDVYKRGSYKPEHHERTVATSGLSIIID